MVAVISFVWTGDPKDDLPHNRVQYISNAAGVVVDIIDYCMIVEGSSFASRAISLGLVEATQSF